MVNVAAALVLFGLGGFLFWRFNLTEQGLIDEKKTIVSAEGRILEAVKKEKEAEIESIQNRLQQAQDAHQAFAAETKAELARHETALKDRFDAELEAERERLRGEGHSEAEVQRRLADFEKAKRQEFDERLATLNAEAEARMKERETQLNLQLDEYRVSLEAARADQSKMKEEIEARLATAREGAVAERNATIERLENLDKRQQEQRFLQEQIVSLYDLVNAKLQHRDYALARRDLDALEEFIDRPRTTAYLSGANRYDVEKFLIASLRRLVDDETALSAPPDESVAAARSILVSVEALVREGNRLYDSGDREAAGERYSEALRRIPGVGTGYDRLREMKAAELERDRASLDEKLGEKLAEGERLFRGDDYRASIERYREALRLLDRKPPSLANMLEQVLDAGYRLKKQDEPPPERTVVKETVKEYVPAELSPEDAALVERARASESVRRNLALELDRMATEYESSTGDGGADEEGKKLIAFLNARLQVREALAGDVIKSLYPDLHKTADFVMFAYGEEQRREGRTAMLEELISLTEHLARQDHENIRPPLLVPDTSVQRRLLTRFVESLKTLLASEF